MALLEQDHAFEIADAIVAASEADETEVTLDCVEDRFVRFGHDGPTQSADRERYDLAVRVRFRPLHPVLQDDPLTPRLTPGSWA